MAVGQNSKLQRGCSLKSKTEEGEREKKEREQERERERERKVIIEAKEREIG